LYRLNANGDAELRAWKIAVIATAPVNGAAAWVSSQLATLTVAEPFVQMKIEMASCEPGQTARVVCTLDQKVPFEGKATCQLLGLPNAVIAPDAEFTKDDKQSSSTRRRRRRRRWASTRLVLRSDDHEDGEPIPHSVGAAARCVLIDRSRCKSPRSRKRRSPPRLRLRPRHPPRKR